jgi:16S rRNA (guanine1207-N2)-methyltransferase
MKRLEFSSTYTQRQEFSISLGGENTVFISKPGIPNWNQVSPSATLLAENVSLTGDSRALFLGCSHGAAGVALTRRLSTGELWLMDTNFIALQMSAETLQVNQITNAKVYPKISALPDQSETFDIVILDLPKGRNLARRWLTEAFGALRVGGHLYLAGANDLGIKPAIRDAEALFGEAQVLAFKRGNRIAHLVKNRATPPQITWLYEPGIAPNIWLEIQLETPQGPLRVHTLPGIFAFDRLDPGTYLLLTSLEVIPGERVLDLGCGYGVIGLIAARSGAAQVDLIDTNLLAVAATAENLSLHDITNARAFPSDVLSAVRGEHYHLIATNPPFHTGKPVDYQIAKAFIQQSWQALEKSGRFLLVANRFIPYDRLMEQIFNEVRCVAQTGQYHVLLATK